MSYSAISGNRRTASPCLESQPQTSGPRASDQSVALDTMLASHQNPLSPEMTTTPSVQMCLFGLGCRLDLSRRDLTYVTCTLFSVLGLDLVSTCPPPSFCALTDGTDPPSVGTFTLVCGSGPLTTGDTYGVTNRSGRPTLWDLCGEPRGGTGDLRRVRHFRGRSTVRTSLD